MSDLDPIALQKHLAGVEYPAGRHDLVEAARGNGADSTVLDRLEGLPGGQFSGPDQVSKELF